MTGCFPNQLYGATVAGSHLYVTSMCTSPRGPLGPRDAEGNPTDRNFKTLFHPAVHVVDLVSGEELAQSARLLTRVLSDYYEAGEDSSGARMPLIPNDIAFGEHALGGSAYVTALGADAVFRLDYTEDAQLSGIGSAGARYIDAAGLQGALPVGVAVSKSPENAFALVANDGVQRLSIIDLATERVHVVQSVPSTPHAVETLESDAHHGRRFFASGVDVWSYKGQAWGSCEACHPGGLSDGVTWYFARGPRRTISAAGTYEKQSPVEARQRRLMLWGANIDEVHDIEVIVRGVTGGAGAVLWTYARESTNDCRLLYDGSAPSGSGNKPCKAPKPTTLLHNGLNNSLAAIVTGQSCASSDVSCDSSGAVDWNQIDTFLRTLRAPRAPSNLPSDEIAAGREIFERARCAGCHGSPGFTLSRVFYEPGAQFNGTLPYQKPGAPASASYGILRERSYEVPEALRVFNPPAAAGGATYRPFPAVASGSLLDVTQLDYAYDPAAQGGDQLSCALRAVGTFPPQVAGEAPNFVGIASTRTPPLEYRQDMKSLAQGANGFNVPSLVGLGPGAPYLHAGNAATLEELFEADAFSAHSRAFAPELFANPLTRKDEIRQLVTFLLSIDDTTAPVEVPTTDLDGAPLDYDLCR